MSGIGEPVREIEILPIFMPEEAPVEQPAGRPAELAPCADPVEAPAPAEPAEVPAER